jgi:hypothetical protein
MIYVVFLVAVCGLGAAWLGWYVDVWRRNGDFQPVNHFKIISGVVVLYGSVIVGLITLIGHRVEKYHLKYRKHDRAHG